MFKKFASISSLGVSYGNSPVCIDHLPNFGRERKIGLTLPNPTGSRMAMIKRIKRCMFSYGDRWQQSKKGLKRNELMGHPRQHV